MLLYQRDPKGPDDARDGMPDRIEPPFTGSIHSTLEASSAPVPSILHQIDAACQGGGTAKLSIKLPETVSRSLWGMPASSAPTPFDTLTREDLEGISLSSPVFRERPKPASIGDEDFPLLERLNEYSELATLISSRHAHDPSCGNQLDPIAGAKGALAQLLRHGHRAITEGRDVAPLLDMLQSIHAALLKCSNR